MGNLCGGEASQQTAADRQITRELHEAHRQLAEEVKLLLLGPGESGKSTIFKQMKVLQAQQHGDKVWTNEELINYKFIIFSNVITQMKQIIQAAEQLNIPIEADHAAMATEVLSLPVTGDVWDERIGKLMLTLWNDKGIKTAFEARDKHYQLNDTAAYFFSNVDRYMAKDYVPSLSDVLRARVRTTGIDEALFKIEDFSFRLVDVGGQRSERRKWIHCFDSVTAVIFCVALSEYDQTLREDMTQNRMKESLMLFDEVCNSVYFRKTPVILFLNKDDLFKEKIKKIDLNVCFSNYTGGCDYKNAIGYIKARFLETNHSPHVIYPHLTCAIDSDNVRFVFKVVKETIIQKTLVRVMEI
jgi:GTPase SAR1 family protein